MALAFCVFIITLAHPAEGEFYAICEPCITEIYVLSWKLGQGMSQQLRLRQLRLSRFGLQVQFVSSAVSLGVLVWCIWPSHAFGDNCCAHSPCSTTSQCSTDYECKPSKHDMQCHRMSMIKAVRSHFVLHGLATHANLTVEEPGHSGNDSCVPRRCAGRWRRSWRWYVYLGGG